MARGEITALRDVAMDFANPTNFTHKEVQYKIDGPTPGSPPQGPYVLFIPLLEFTPQKARDLVAQKVKEWAATVGKSIEEK